MNEPQRTSLAWCWAGLAIVVGLGLPLADAQNLFSLDDRLAELGLGPWWALDDVGSGDVHWSFRITPWAAWWGIFLGGLLAALGWQAHRRRESLPFGGLGILICVALLGTLLAENLLTAFLLAATLALICGFRQAVTACNLEEVRRYFQRMLISDTLGLIGVLLAGLASGTLDFVLLADAEFVQRGFEQRPAWCGLAGSCLFLCLLGRCGLFPASGVADPVASPLEEERASVRGFVDTLVWAICVWPASLWLFWRVQPLLAVVPETGSLVQGIALLAAVMAAFIATAATDSQRAVRLIAASQVAVILAALVLQDVFSPVWLALTAGSLTLGYLAWSTWRVTQQTPLSRLVGFIALAAVAGGPLSPAFWMVGRSVAQFQVFGATHEMIEAESSSDTEEEIVGTAAATQEASRPRSLPLPTWCAGWWAWSFFAAFAAWRVWKFDGSKGMKRQESVPPPAVTSSRFLTVSAALLTAAGGCAGWLMLHEANMEAWPMAGAAAASLGGWMASAWLCRDPARPDLGSWTKLARREFYVPDLISRCIIQPLKEAAEWVRLVDGHVFPAVNRWIAASLAPAFSAAADELHSESPRFYGIAVTLIIASLLVTWVWIG